MYTKFKCNILVSLGGFKISVATFGGYQYSEDPDFNFGSTTYQMGFPDSSVGKESACNVRPGFNPWVEKIPLEKGKATHSSILT